MPRHQTNPLLRNRAGARLTRRVAAAALFAVSTVSFAQTYITPSTPGWIFSEEAPVASGGFVNGPGTPPSGSAGSYQITVQQPGGGLFYTQQYAGTRLDQLAGLKYSTYVVSSALPVTATMSFDFDNDMAVVAGSYGGRAVFDPALLGAVIIPGTWQTWDPMNQKAWWGSGAPGTRPLNIVCTQAAPCTFAQMLAAFPNGGVLADQFPGFFGFKLGNGGGPSQVSVDSFSIGVTGPDGPVTQFNFAPGLPGPPPLSRIPTLGDAGMVLLAMLAALTGLIALRRRT
jgi:hypothetical protein